MEKERINRKSHSEMPITKKLFGFSGRLLHVIGPSCIIAPIRISSQSDILHMKMHVLVNSVRPMQATLRRLVLQSNDAAIGDLNDSEADFAISRDDCKTHLYYFIYTLDIASRLPSPLSTTKRVN